MKFKSSVRIDRLTDGDDGPVTAYAADVHINCADCGLPFRFMGLPFGSHPTEPRLSADSLEMRAPIEPAYAIEICGQPVVSGNA
jgi:hypothetical protein